MATSEDEAELPKTVALRNAESILVARRRAEDALLEQTEWLRVMLASIGDAVIGTDALGLVTYLNGVAEALTGWTGPAAVGRPLEEVFRIVDEKTRRPVESPVDRVLRQERVANPEGRTILIGRDGVERPIDENAAPIKDDQGRITGIVLVFRDVTERRRADAEMDKLREEERAADLRAVQILESVTDAFFSLDRQWRFTYFNPRAESLLRRAPAELIGKVVWEEFPAALGTRFEREYQAAMTERRVVTFEEYYPAPLDAWFEVHGYPSADGITVYFRNVTERKRAEEDRRAAEHRTRTVLESINEGFVAVDSTWHFTYMNARAERMYGMRREDVLGRSLWDVFPEASGTVFEREYRRAMADRVMARVDAPFDRLGAWFEVNVYPVGDGGLSFYMVDVTERKRAEREARAKDERLNLFVENVKDYAVIIFDPSGRIIEWQGGAERITGYAPVEAVGHRLGLLFTPEDRAVGQPDAEMAHAIATGRAEDKRWHLRKDGSRFFADGVMTALYDDGGKLRGFGKVFKDATGEKQAEEATRRRTFQLQKLADISARINEAHDVASVVGVMTEEARELIGARQAATSLVPAAHHPRPILVVATAGGPTLEKEWSNDEAAQFREVVGRQDRPLRLAGAELPDDPRWPSLGKVALEEPAAQGWLAVPIVGRDGASMGLLQLADKEEGEFTDEDEAILVQLSRIAAIAIDNAKLYDELKGNDRRKDEFLAMLAHELRNPLAAIGNAVGVSARSGRPDDVDWSMEVITRQLRHLTRLIDDLLDVSRISRGKIELRKNVLEATPILESALATVGPLAEERKHAIAVEVDRGNLWVDADPTRLEQVVVNLLNNAAKYSENGGEIRLSARNEGNEVVIVVGDKGVGIPPEKLPQMFELFAQGDRSLARSEGGLGIGLTVVKKLVEMHGGGISARSEGLNRGSEFTIRLPGASRPATPKPTESARPASGGRAGRVLIVDDNVDTARGMARLLKLTGHDVATAHDGHEALAVAREFGPEFVLLDIGLPGMNGYEVASQLRLEAFGRDALIVAVSGYGQEEDRRRSKEAGFDHHLIKPIDHDSLLALLSAEEDGPG
jgi:PAS domain S-box-containing protein